LALTKVEIPNVMIIVEYVRFKFLNILKMEKTMKKLLAAVFTLAIGSAVFAQQFNARIDVNGQKDLELKPVEKGNMRNISWGAAEKRKFSMTGASANLPKDKWTKITFAFVPEQDGSVRINLMGQWRKGKGKKQIDQMWVYFSSISVEGAKIKNGDFSEVKNGVPVGWSCAKDQYVTEGVDFPEGSKAAVKVWHNKRCSQYVAVKAGQTVTITAYVRPAEYIEASE
jgi:hypothetical protein